MQGAAARTGSNGIKSPWALFAILYIACLSAPLNMFKVSAVSPLIMEAFNIDAAGIGFLMSAYTVTGVVLALPGGAIACKIGLKQSALAALVISIVGGLIGSVAADYNMLMVSRVLEGIGLCMMGITGVSLTVGYFPREKRGFAMGIFTTYMALAGCVGVLILGAIGDAVGYKAVWWACLGYTVVVTVLFALFIRNPEEPEEEKAAVRRGMWKEIASHPQLWLLCIIFTLHNFVVPGALSSFSSAYLVSKFGLSLTAAAGVSAVFSVACMACMIAIGKISDKTGSRKRALVFGLIVGVVCVGVYFWTDSLPLVVVVCAIMGIEGCVPSIAQAAGPEILGKQELAPVAQGFLSFGQNIGQFIGASAFGIAVTQLGYSTASFAVLVPLMAIAAVIACVMKIK